MITIYTLNSELLNSNLKVKTQLVSILQKVYGIGYLRARKIITVFGYNINVRIFEMKPSDIKNIIKFMEKNFIINEPLKRIVSYRINTFIEIRSIKGIRHSLGLPVRGQRTHTNAGTPYRLKFHKGRGRVKVRKKNKKK